MQRRELNLGLDWGLLPAALATFSTGLVLLLRFHAGHEVFATEALGVNKLIWANVHRLSAVLVIAGVMTHVALHWRAFRVHLTNASIRRTRKPVDSELIMYTAFLIASLTGLVTWLILKGSSPLFGPAVLGRPSSTRHPWIDIHHVSSLILLVLVIHHLAHRWRFMRTRPLAGTRGLGRVREPLELAGATLHEYRAAIGPYKEGAHSSFREGTEVEGRLPTTSNYCGMSPIQSIALVVPEPLRSVR